MTVNQDGIDVTRASPTGIKVIIVGAGFGGLTAAIECHLNGHDVVLLEAVRELKPYGDIISFGNNAGRIFGHWSKGYMLKEFLGRLFYYPYFSIRKYDGTEIAKQGPPPRIPDAPNFSAHRGELHLSVYHYAKDVLGIDIRLDARVVKYWEDEKGAGVETANGEKFEGDVVIGSDGVKSKARELVLGYYDKPHSSGYACFRAWFPGAPLLDDPLTKEFVDYGDTFTGWVGPHVHFLCDVTKGGRECSFFLTHKDEADIDESWSFPGKTEDVLAVVKDWDPKCAAIIKKAPESAIIDFKLVYRDPLPTWVSKNARICVLGDAAHPFLPTSQQGGSQAMEDGATIGICLRRAGKGNIPLGLRVYERMRYDRVRRVQKMGEEIRDSWHKADWNEVFKNPKLVYLPHPPYVLFFDVYKFTEENFDKVADEVRQGRTLEDFDDPEHSKKMPETAINEIPNN